MRGLVGSVGALQLTYSGAISDCVRRVHNTKLPTNIVSTYASSAYSRQHLQLLLYFATLEITSPTTPSPISILFHWLDIHGAELAPLLPRREESRGNTDKRAAWLSWPAQNKLLLDAKIALRPCEKQGIWALTWGQAKRESDDEEVDHVPSEAGWEVLSFLASLWEAEAETGSFKSFVAQMGRPEPTLVHDNADALFAIVKTAFPQESKFLTAGTFTNRQTAVRLLALLFRAANANVFLPAALILSFIYFLRPYQGVHLSSLLGAISPIDKSARAHILTLALEDAAGLRAARVKARKRRDDGQGLQTPFAPPTIRYALDLIAEVNGAREDILAAHLISLLPDDKPWPINESYLNSLGGRAMLRKLLQSKQKL